MWTSRTTTVGAGRVLGCGLFRQSRAMTFAEVIQSWAVDAAFRQYWIDTLLGTPWPAWCLELPALSANVLHAPFECVMVDSPRLANTCADSHPFRDQFRHGVDCVAFDSLAKDACLIAPCPRQRGVDYAHLAGFLRTADERTAQALWVAVAAAFASRCGPRPLWLSTAGLGVAWLHVRLDWRPKYYRFAAYADPDYLNSAR
ncbi:DUF6940 family protein [Tahibacter amnicola]|uniref:Uncharacterized protein n=1 Tax=Tahibacter amnicola TaxID=2976241 RepID=A0ABY6B921_9GAMM|nr:hypothetical protein [Tahibacter amnicola]UXI66563.1 hypothetical protein N4264_17645 [Tahibacter amnicola]